MSKLFCFGLGYSASALARRLAREDWAVAGTSSRAEGVARIAAAQPATQVLLFDGHRPGEGVAAALGQATHVLVSPAPDGDGDPVLRCHAADLAAAPGLRWIGYLSTVGVYGDHDGAWVDEATAPRPVSERSRRRVAAEAAWLAFADRVPSAQVQVFRLAGIYGPGRSAIDDLADGTARRIVKPGQVFNRIHVDDIAHVVAAAMTGRGRAGGVYNVTDDEPAPPQDVVAHAAELMGLAPPPDVPFAQAGLSPMGLSFYGECKRVSNRRLKTELVPELLYPSYREGLRAVLAARRARRDG